MNRISSALYRLAAVSLAALLAGTAADTAKAQLDLPIYDYRVQERRAQPRHYFVQGLEIRDDRLYVSTGQYGESRLIEYDYPQFTLRRERQLPENLFGEGVTRLDDRLFQLTWRAGKVLAYEARSLDQVAEFPLATEGWGLTNNGSELIVSDGSALLAFLDPQTLERRKTLPVTPAGPTAGASE